ncbi:MAG TPA: NADPH-dependent assimilatory sulfite reductase hemoprotein subunit [Candidatus Dormibacteraeota bacterium]|nr:NADPH-dependent assimilatory sulfite reductase hemoprotein subunit [Candidatus Dormibacteraeota bacterium]
MSKASRVEEIKAASRHLRGTIAEELDNGVSGFGEESAQLVKFHGIYEQEDRDRRSEARRTGAERSKQMMLRTRIPGGVVSAAGYLAHDEIAGRWADGTLRVTTRQDIQLYGVLKGDLRSAIRAINATLVTTLGGCGDQARNIMCCAAPVRDRFHGEVLAAVAGLVHGLTPSTRAYHEIWLDGELAASSGPDEPELEPLYGETYLPRKFKTAVALEGDNCVDVYANDLGLVALRDGSGGLGAFDILVGGGMGRTRGKPETFAAVAQPLARVPADRVVEAARAVVTVQRDLGDRTDRRHARLKYLIADRGLAWFRERVQEHLDFPLEDPSPLIWPPVDDHLGWHEQGDGLLYLGVHVENGRIADRAGVRLRTGLRAIVAELRPQVRLTPQQNVILADVRPRDRARVDELLREHGIPAAADIPATVRNAMACPALPTCGLAVAESERAMPALVRDISALVEELGLAGERISWRMTGCPNGCARPYLGDVGFVGTTLGKYDVFLGGDAGGTRLNQLYAGNVPLGEIVAMLRGPLTAYRDERRRGESFGGFCHRRGVAGLRDRFGVQAPPPSLVPLPMAAGAEGSAPRR